MRSTQQSPMWPYLGVLACLFLLSITAPRAWEQLARQETLSQILASRKARQAAQDSPPTTRQEQLGSSEPIESIDDELTRRPPVAEQPAAQVEPQRATAAENVADASATPSPVLQIVPPAPEFASQANEPASTAEKSATPEPAEADDAAADNAPQHAAQRPMPKSLLKQLRLLIEADSSATWAEKAIRVVDRMARSQDDGSTIAASDLAQLRALVDGNTTAVAADPALEARLNRARYALARWVGSWEGAVTLDQAEPDETLGLADGRALRRALADVDALLRRGSSGSQWRAYLQLDALKRLAGGRAGGTDEERHAVAREVLDRLAASRLSSAQEKFVTSGPIAVLETALRPWAAAKVGSADLLSHLAQYEWSGLPSEAKLVANDLRDLHWSSGLAAEQISQHLDTHYRNANLRIAVTSTLLNRLVPQPKAIEAPVRDRVVNVPVYGRSTTLTKLHVRLVPDPRRIRLGLEASGSVASDTVSASGPARLYNEGQSSFLVRKLLVLGPRGLSVWPAIAEAENDYSYLVSLETDFDGVPLVGSLVRSIARSQYEEKSGEAQQEVEQKVAMRARDQLDAEIRPYLVKAAESLEQKQLATLKRLGLDLTTVGMSTTEDRAVARWRISSPEQLGAHTPRPRAPSDSWMSLQLHESALNNVLEQLDLNGREFTLQELFAWIGDKLNRPQMTDLEELPENVQLHFASQDAVRLRCENDRVEVTFAFAELRQGGSRWHNFSVRTYYRPEAQDRDARFVRDSAISLDGKSLRGKLDVKLRTIFSKVLARNRELHLLGEEFTHDPRIKDLQISQFTVDDGWIALAYGPQRQRGNVARRPE